VCLLGKEEVPSSNLGIGFSRIHIEDQDFFFFFIINPVVLSKEVKLMLVKKEEEGPLTKNPGIKDSSLSDFYPDLIRLSNLKGL
jgi:hypothetical protein